MERNQILQDIYTKLYLCDHNWLNVFLCGGSIRDGLGKDLRSSLHEELMKRSKVNVVLPEYIFDFALRRQGQDLLSLEELLAENVDVIILPLESPGTFCELGVFANNKLASKLFVIIDIFYKKDKSFINQGPIKYLKKMNSRIEYFENTEQGRKDITQKVSNSINYFRWTSHLDGSSRKDMRNIFDITRLVLFIIAMFQPIDRSEINAMLLELKIDKENTKYLDVFIKTLVSQLLIEMDFDENFNEVYNLSSNGNVYVFDELIASKNVKKYFWKIRAEILNSKKLRRAKIEL